MNPYLDLHRLEFSITYRCSAHCLHCQVEDDLRRSAPAAIDPTLGAQIVHRVARAYPLRSLMTFGGEPLLYPEAVCAIHQAAQEEGIAHRSIITNASVPRPEAAFRALARRLAACGVNAVYISVDAFHQANIPLEVVERNARALAEAGIEELVWNPCWVVSREHDNTWNRRTREVLAALSYLPAREDEGNVVQPDGHARDALAEFLPPKVPLPAGSCGDMPYTGPLDEIGSIGVEPDGAISVCHELAIGNAAQEDVIEILQRYDPYQIPEARALLQGGVGALVELARARGIALDRDGYYSVCDLCRSLRRQMKE
jgi:MoaA/NifB/PqqE/SkfB family radical SAM enzyme